MTSTIPVTGEFSALRSAVYRLLLTALDKPTPEQHALLLGSKFRASLSLLCGLFDTPFPGGERVPSSYPDFESRYLATFEVGLPEAPVVLLASHHIRHEPAPRVVHEHILFYKHFRYSPMEETGEAADHLLNELRFLIHLDRLREHCQSSADSLDRARRDFLDRHPLRWIARASDRASERGIAPFYRCVLRLLSAVVREDRMLLDGEDDSRAPSRTS